MALTIKAVIDKWKRKKKNSEEEISVEEEDNSEDEDKEEEEEVEAKEKNTEEEDLLKEVDSMIVDLLKMTIDDYSKMSYIMDKICSIYREHDTDSTREKVGNILSAAQFPVAAITILKYMTEDRRETEEPPSDKLWKIEENVRSILWNYTGASSTFATKVAEAGGVFFFTDECSFEPYLCSPSNQKIQYVIGSGMGTLLNMSKITDVIQYFIDSNTAEVMSHFLTIYADAWKEKFRVTAILMLPYIVEEKKNEKLIADTDTFKAIIEFLNVAFEDSSESFMGFSTSEIVHRLYFLSFIEEHRRKIIDAKALPVFLRLLQSENEMAKIITVSTIENLTFNKDVCKSIADDEHIVQALHNLDSSNEELKNIVYAVLSILSEETDVPQHQESEKKKQGHIFLSYSWKQKAVVWKLNDRLKSAGYTVWIDKEQMKGGLYDKMAEAVENAFVVIAGVSEDYKESANCKRELMYAARKEKDIIPLVLQKKYKADGWLGFLISGQIYYDFSGKHAFDKVCEELLNALKAHTSGN